MVECSPRRLRYCMIVMIIYDAQVLANDALILRCDFLIELSIIVMKVILYYKPRIIAC